MNDSIKIPDIILSCNNQDMQVEVIHTFLNSSYWAKGISIATVQQSIENSLCFAAFIDGRQVAFARVITDKASFAYLADVFVVSEFRGLGISKKLMAFVMQHDDLQYIRRFMLCTADAHGLYEQFGFSVTQSPEKLMAIHRADIYTRG